jgi:hypothetical protein
VQAALAAFPKTIPFFDGGGLDATTFSAEDATDDVVSSGDEAGDAGVTEQ